MDGHFVDNLTFGPVAVEAVRPHSALPFHSHLMISRPLAYAERFAQAGSDLIVFHVEADDEPRAVIAEIERAGKRPGIALNPETPAEAVLPWLDRVDLLLVMTVHPGWGGQAFLHEVVPEAASPPRRGGPAGARAADRRRRRREPRDDRRRPTRAGETCSWSAAPCTVPPATWRPRSPPCGPPPGHSPNRDRSARRKDLTLLPRRSLWLGLLVLVLPRPPGRVSARTSRSSRLPSRHPSSRARWPSASSLAAPRRRSRPRPSRWTARAVLTDADGAATLTALRGRDRIGLRRRP